jgi:hypothetical protein
VPPSLSRVAEPARGGVLAPRLVPMATASPLSRHRLEFAVLAVQLHEGIAKLLHRHAGIHRRGLCDIARPG